MYLYQITITDKDKPENPECLDNGIYNVGAKSLPDAIKTAWEKYDLSENFDPQQDAMVIRFIGDLLV